MERNTKERSKKNADWSCDLFESKKFFPFDRTSIAKHLYFLDKSHIFPTLKVNRLNVLIPTNVSFALNSLRYYFLNLNPFAKRTKEARARTHTHMIFGIRTDSISKIATISRRNKYRRSPHECHLLMLLIVFSRTYSVINVNVICEIKSERKSVANGETIAMSQGT